MAETPFDGKSVFVFFLQGQSLFGKSRVLQQTDPAMIRFLHTRIRVRDLDKSVAFYLHLGYVLREFKDSPQGNRLAFLALPGNDVFLELCHSPDYTASCPEDLMHTALGVPDIIEYCDKVEKAGIEIWPSGWREKFSSGARKMAFVTDPDGYEVEILEL